MFITNAGNEINFTTLFNKYNGKTKILEIDKHLKKIIMYIRPKPDTQCQVSHGLKLSSPPIFINNNILSRDINLNINLLGLAENMACFGEPMFCRCSRFDYI